MSQQETTDLIKASRALLTMAGVFFGSDDDDPKFAQTLNMNDVWGWATAGGHYVSNKQLPEVAQLFRTYGWCGIIYWVSEQYEGGRSEFHHYNRFIDFVRQEERVRNSASSVSEYAYKKVEYTLGKK